MATSDESQSISIAQPSLEILTDVDILLIEIAKQDWFRELSEDQKNHIINSAIAFCSFAWVKELNPMQRFECFLGYLQYEFLKQGLRRQQQARDFVFYGFSAAGGVTPTLEPIGIEVR